MLFGLFADGLFLFADFCNFFCELEGVGDDLGEGFLVELCFFGQFQVVVGDSLLEDSRNLFEYFSKVFFELWSEVLKEMLYPFFNLFSVDLLQVLLNLTIDP